jgi:hypothetical protein
LKLATLAVASLSSNIGWCLSKEPGAPAGNQDQAAGQHIEHPMAATIA